MRSPLHRRDRSLRAATVCARCHREAVDGLVGALGSEVCLGCAVVAVLASPPGAWEPRRPGRHTALAGGH